MDQQRAIVGPYPQSLALDRDNAFSLAFQRDLWIWVKAPLWLLLVFLFYAEAIWKAGTLLVGSLSCHFVYPCIAGSGISEGSLWAAFLFRFFLIVGVTWYVTYTLAWLSLPGAKFKLAASIAALLFPMLLIVGVVIGALGLERVGIPMEQIASFEQRYAPFDSWRQHQATGVSE
jgi:hypothetical protein